MPTFNVTVQGKTYCVEIPDPGASPLRVIVDGQAFDVAIAEPQAVGRAAPRVEAPPPVSQPTMLPPLPKVELARPVSDFGPSSSNEIIAPMPGTIIAVQVAVGQEVRPGQVVCILEAMKMKNPIRVTRAGRVAEILVSPGQTVAYGHVLIRLAE